MRHASLGRTCLVLSLFGAAPAAAAGPDTRTFSKHVAPIFQEKCEACHRPDSIAPIWLNPPYFLDFFKTAATENEPPVVRMTADGPGITGPPLGIAHAVPGAVRQPIALRLWASDVPARWPGAADELTEQRSKRPSVVEPFAVVGDQSFGGIREGAGALPGPTSRSAGRCIGGQARSSWRSHASRWSRRRTRTS